jgi:hypothetical protein
MSCALPKLMNFYEKNLFTSYQNKRQHQEYATHKTKEKRRTSEWAHTLANIQGSQLNKPQAVSLTFDRRDLLVVECFDYGGVYHICKFHCCFRCRAASFRGLFSKLCIPGAHSKSGRDHFQGGGGGG